MQEPTGRSAPPRPSWVFAGAAAGAALVLIAVVVAIGLGWIRSSDDAAAPAPAPRPTITLTDAEADAAASCIAPSAERMRAENDLAFAGTVREVEPGSALFDVDRWYTDEAAGTVRLERVGEMPGLLYTPDLQAGQRYLIVATDGVIRYCDPSGPWSAELERLFEDAFGIGSPAG